MKRIPVEAVISTSWGTAGCSRSWTPCALACRQTPTHEQDRQDARPVSDTARVSCLQPADAIPISSGWLGPAQLLEYLAQFVFHLLVVMKCVRLTLSVGRPAGASVEPAQTVVRHDVGGIVLYRAFQK